MHISRYKTTQDSCHILQTQQKLPNGNKHEPVYCTHLYFLSYYEPITLSYFFTLVISTFLLKIVFFQFFLLYFCILTCNIFCSFFPLFSIFWEQVEEKQCKCLYQQIVFLQKVCQNQTVNPPRGRTLAGAKKDEKPLQFCQRCQSKVSRIGTGNEFMCTGITDLIYRGMWISCVFKFTVCRMKHTKGQVQAPEVLFSFPVEKSRNLKMFVQVFLLSCFSTNL